MSVLTGNGDSFPTDPLFGRLALQARSYTACTVRRADLLELIERAGLRKRSPSVGASRLATGRHMAVQTVVRELLGMVG